MDRHYATEIAYRNGYKAGRKDALSTSKEPTEKKQYLIDEDTLKELLYASHKLEILERDGVDNWWAYMEGRTEYLAECAAMLPWNEGRSDKDLTAQIEEEGYYIDDLVEDQISAFWEEVV
jgi:hypothetical protein